MQAKTLASGALIAGLLATVGLPVTAEAATIVPGFNGSALPRNDDGSTGLVPLGFTFNFYGANYSGAYVNNNGNVTFNSALSTFTPFGLTGGVPQPIIAPFFADVDTRGAGSAEVTYGTGTFGGNAAFGVNWVNVGYYASHDEKLNSFQLLLVNRSDLGAGNLDFYFNYGSITWETGDASGGGSGLGGSCARAGYSNGTGNPGTFLELAGSGVCGAFLDGGSNALASGTNDGVPGQFLFQIRNGVVVVPPPPTAVPEPATLALLAAGLAGLAAVRRRGTAG